MTEQREGDYRPTRRQFIAITAGALTGLAVPSWIRAQEEGEGEIDSDVDVAGVTSTPEAQAESTATPTPSPSPRPTETPRVEPTPQVPQWETIDLAIPLVFIGPREGGLAFSFVRTTVDPRATEFKVVADMTVGGNTVAGLIIQNAEPPSPRQERLSIRPGNPWAITYMSKDQRAWFEQLSYNGMSGRIECLFDRDGRSVRITTPDSITAQFDLNGNSILQPGTRRLEVGAVARGGSDVVFRSPVQFSQLISPS